MIISVMDTSKIYALVVMLSCWTKQCGGQYYTRKPKYPNVVRNRSDPIKCYQCEYTENYGRISGDAKCVNSSAVINTTEVVRCLGHCETSYMRLDSWNMRFIRGCSTHCHDNSHDAPRDMLRECCEENYCNTAAKLMPCSLYKLYILGTLTLYLVKHSLRYSTGS